MFLTYNVTRSVVANVAEQIFEIKILHEYLTGVLSIDHINYFLLCQSANSLLSGG